MKYRIKEVVKEDCEGRVIGQHYFVYYKKFFLWLPFIDLLSGDFINRKVYSTEKGARAAIDIDKQNRCNRKGKKRARFFEA